MDLLRHLELFEAVADEEHFGRAAQSVGMAQPPMSQAIRRLERELGCSLFQRTPRGAQLTDAGRRVLREAMRVRDDVDRLRTVARSATRAPLELLVDPGCPQEWASRFATTPIAPGADIHLRPCPTAETVTLIREQGGIGLVLAPVRTEGLRVSQVTTCRLWELVPDASPQAPRHALLHENPPAPALRALTADLRAQGMLGPFDAEAQISVVADLHAGKLTRALSIGRPPWHDSWTADLTLRPLPEPVSARFQLVARRDERSRVIHEAWDALHAVLDTLPQDG
ncbi:LysR family transcriptional regulator [Brachybacterium squillarum]|uniref:LysR family transcriptional regulator n=1 Tax=Brachybacterium squillarum TaxID=661979 RepID=UPI0002629B79|nr:LysR family transcriptional regulator [Brachybacterium squillarum]